jgi:ribosomal peptide maturation radical SAM protein 1
MDVVFAVMPFADVGRPAIGVSLLKQAAAREGFTSTIEYCGLRLAGQMGVDLYQSISSAFAPDLLLGEWFFADAVFDEELPPDDDYFHRILAPYVSPETIARVAAARAHRERFLDQSVERLAGLGPKVVGFTTTFHQTCASLAAARRLKALPDPPIVVFGGANCEGEMGLQMLESFPWIDYVCSGESDVSFVRLLEHLLRGGPAPAGVLARGTSAPAAPSATVQDLDALPYPDYDDYFAQLEASGVGRGAAVHVIVETSRGCWWGAKHHCTFCGLNGETMAFRSKSPTRAFEEIAGLTRRYGLSKVGCVDNILDLRYVDTLFPRLEASGLELELFYEVKANLRYEQLRTMHRGGLRQIQPGIESFSDAVLRLMDKGVTGLQNVQLLRWCEELGIDCAWNLLAGFPHEPSDEYARMADLVPLLTHLNPPSSCAQVRLDRFSPFHTRSATLGFRNVRPSRAYYYVYPLGRRELGRLAYFFDFDYDDGRDPTSYLRPLQQAVQGWWASRLQDQSDLRPRLDARFVADAVLVTDTRPAARAAEHELTGVHARIFTLCDTVSTEAALLRRPELGADVEAVRRALDDLVDDRLLARDAGHYLTLAVFRDRPAGLAHLRSHGHIPIATTPSSHPLLPVA